jgi:hypothetical protein
MCCLSAGLAWIRWPRMPNYRRAGCIRKSLSQCIGFPVLYATFRVYTVDHDDGDITMYARGFVHNVQGCIEGERTLAQILCFIHQRAVILDGDQIGREQRRTPEVFDRPNRCVSAFVLRIPIFCPISSSGRRELWSKRASDRSVPECLSCFLHRARPRSQFESFVKAECSHRPTRLIDSSRSLLLGLTCSHIVWHAEASTTDGNDSFLQNGSPRVPK